MFCENCGSKLPETANFCTGCGARVRTPAPSPQTPAPQMPAQTQPPPVAYAAAMPPVHEVPQAAHKVPVANYAGTGIPVAESHPAGKCTWCGAIIDVGQHELPEVRSGNGDGFATVQLGLGQTSGPEGYGTAELWQIRLPDRRGVRSCSRHETGARRLGLLHAQRVAVERSAT